MASRTNTSTGKSSFGVEMEGYIAWVLEGTDYPRPNPSSWPASAGPLIIPELMANRLGLQEAVESLLANLIQGLQIGTPGTTVVPPHLRDADLNNATLSHLRSYRYWSVKRDLSLSRVPEELLEVFDGGGEWGWCGFELCSPAMWSTRQSMDEVHRVCKYLTDNYWVSAPAEAGLHVHWGNGTDWIPLDSLRRVAGLLFAADRVLVQLHPQHRRDNMFCLCNSLYSRVTRGVSALDAEMALGIPPQPPGAAPLPEDDDDGDDGDDHVPCMPCCSMGRGSHDDDPDLEAGLSDGLAATTSTRDLDTATRGLGARGALGTFVFDRHYYDIRVQNAALFGELGTQALDDGGDPDPDIRAPPRRIREAVTELLACPNAQCVAELIQISPGLRPAYSFNGYSAGRYGVVGSKRTLEFRQAAGSFDPDEVCGWARVCIRLCEWAVAADLPRFWNLVIDLADAAEGDANWFDVWDLLAEIGLRDVARVLQPIAYRRQGITP